MLQAIRKRSGSILVKLLLGLLILAFASWGIGDVIRTRVADAPVATVGGIDISAQELSTELRRRLRGAADLEQARAMGLVDALLDLLVQRALFDLGGDGLGIMVSDGLVKAQILAMPAFQDAVGGFNPARFQQSLARLGHSEERYVAALRGDMERDQLLESIRSGGRAPRDLVDAIYRHRRESRIAETFFVADADMPDPGAPDDGALDKYHQDNAHLFTAPEYRKITAAVLRAADLAKGIAVPEDSLRQAYEEREDEFNQPERRHVLQMVLGDLAAAGRARDLLSGGADFADVADKVTGQVAVDLGLLSRDELLPELADAAFALSEGSTSAPVKSPLGWHLLRVVKITPAHHQGFEEVRAELAESIASERAIDSLFELANRLEDALGGGATLEEAAAQSDLAVLRIEAIDARGRNETGTPVSGLPLGPEFLRAAFETAEGQESALTEAGSDTYFVLRADAVTAPVLRPLAEVRDQVVAGWKEDRRGEAAQAAAEALLQTVKEGRDGKEVAAAAKAEYGVSEPFTRRPTAAVQRLPASLISDVFALSPGEAVMGRSSGGYTVARLKEVVAAHPGSDGVAALRREMEQAVRSDIVTQFADALRARYRVTKNPAAFDRLF